jgi:ubiquitin carboxyl-terminal hydrolase 9/24
MEDINVCREALEVLCVCLALYPAGLEALNKDKAWQVFIIDLLLLCKSRYAHSLSRFLPCIFFNIELLP